ncbi:penicillin-binding protein [Candidatus Roizmanbacteria bacterium]|nr:penicillin-binding protein [Candidatus Roizmanbacteria bacterium]
MDRNFDNLVRYRPTPPKPLSEKLAETVAAARPKEKAVRLARFLTRRQFVFGAAAVAGAWAAKEAAGKKENQDRALDLLQQLGDSGLEHMGETLYGNLVKPNLDALQPQETPLTRLTEVQPLDSMRPAERPPQNLKDYLTSKENRDRLTDGLTDVYYDGLITFPSQKDNNRLLANEVRQKTDAAVTVLLGLLKDYFPNPNIQISALNKALDHQVDGVLLTNRQIVNELLDYIEAREKTARLPLVFVPPYAKRRINAQIELDYDPQRTAAIRRRALHGYETAIAYYRMSEASHEEHRPNPAAGADPPQKLDTVTGLLLKRYEIDPDRFLAVASDLDRRGAIDLPLMAANDQDLEWLLTELSKQKTYDFRLTGAAGLLFGKKPTDAAARLRKQYPHLTFNEQPTAPALSRRQFLQFFVKFGAVAPIYLAWELAGKRSYSEFQENFLGRFAKLLPFEQRDRPNIQKTTKVYASDGVTLLGEVFDERRDLIAALDEIPAYLQNAVVATEDKTFWENPGVEVSALARAFKNTAAGDGRQGGSTITQQLIKNTCFSFAERAGEYNEGSLSGLNRKIMETALSTAYQSYLEARYGKRKAKELILTNYANIASCGNNIEGFKAAGRVYFNKNLKDLTLEEAAFLAGLPQNPVKYNPLTDPYMTGAKDEAPTGQIKLADSHPARQRQLTVLRLMAEHDPSINAETIWKKGIILHIQSLNNTSDFFRFFRNALTLDPELMKQGLQIRSTLDIDLQRKVQAVIDKYRQELKQKYHVNHVSVCIKKPQTGEIVALTGTPTVEHFPFLLAELPTYAAALEKGTVNPDETVDNSTLTLTTTAFGDRWRPQNFGDRANANGPVPFTKAFARSAVNATARLQRDLGLITVSDFWQRLGLSDRFRIDRSGWETPLGTSALSTPLKILKSYGALVTGGKKVPIKIVHDIKNHGNQNIYNSPSTPSVPVLDPAVADSLRRALTTPGRSYFLKHDLLSFGNLRNGQFGSSSIGGNREYLVYVTTGNEVAEGTTTLEATAPVTSGRIAEELLRLLT